MRWAMTLAWPEFQGQDDALVRVGSQLARVGKGTDAPAPRDRNGAGGPRGGSHSSGQGGRNEYGVPGIQGIEHPEVYLLHFIESDRSS